MSHILALPDWVGMFAAQFNLLETMLRACLVYVFLVVALRLAGKRVLAQLNPFDFVVLLILSNTLQNAILGNNNTVTGGVVGAITLLSLNAAVVGFSRRHQAFDRVVEGGPDPLIVDGRLQSAALIREKITDLELRAAAHRQGFESLSEIESAELDPGGILVFRRRQETADHAQHLAVIERLDRIERLLAARER
jgi:uncharacterized membrane protein YcaP (DUF421 family)